MEKKLSEMTYSEFVGETLDSYARARAFGIVASLICGKIAKLADKTVKTQNTEENGEEYHI